MTPGERGQVTQLEEGLTDEFRMGDLKIDYDFGSVTLTSITTYTDRDVEVMRDASQLTGSVRSTSAAHRREVAPEFAAASTGPACKSFSQELRLASNGTEHSTGWSGRSTRTRTATTARTLPTPGYDAVVADHVGQTPADVGNRAAR